MNLPTEWNVFLQFPGSWFPHRCSICIAAPGCSLHFQQNMCYRKQTSTSESENLPMSKRFAQIKWAAARGVVGWVCSREHQKQTRVWLEFFKKYLFVSSSSSFAQEQFEWSSIQRKSGRVSTFLLWQVLQSIAIAFTGCHLYTWEKKHLHLSLFNSEIFVDHYPCILLQRIIMSFFSAYPHQTSSDSLDLNKLQVLLSILPYFCYVNAQRSQAEFQLPLLWEFPG